jgi:hypothetical protein
MRHRRSHRHRNPLSDKRRFHLETSYAQRYKLDDDSIKDVSESEIKARKEKLNQLLDWLALADPTESGKYAMWIAKLYKRDLVQFPEDIEKINSRLQKFDKVKHTLPVDRRDINSFKTYGELAKTLDEHQGVGVREAARLATVEGQEVIFEGPIGETTFRIIKVTTQEAATKLARHTDWCVKDPSWGTGYLEWGPLYFIDRSQTQRHIHAKHAKSKGLRQLRDDTLTVVWKRHALAWKGSCEKRKEQYARFVEFIEDCNQKKLCYFCLKSASKCSTEHSMDEYEFQGAYQESWDDSFNYSWNEEDLFSHRNGPKDLGEIPDHLKAFISKTPCKNFYSVLDVYDDPFNGDEAAELRPLLIGIFEPDIATASRDSLKEFYEEVLGNKEHRGTEKKLISAGNANKILDYFESMDNLKDSGKDSGRGGRWLEIEPLVLSDVSTAARYYNLIKATNAIDEEELNELAALREKIPQAPKPSVGSPPRTLRERGSSSQDYSKKKAKANKRIKDIRKKLREDKKKIEIKLRKAQGRNDLAYQKLLSIMEKAVSDADRGVALEKILPRIHKAADVYYGYLDNYYEDPQHPVSRFIIDLIAHYNNGIIKGRSRRRRKRRFRRHGRQMRGRQGRAREDVDFVGEQYIADPGILLPPSHRSSWKVRKKRKITKKQAALVRSVSRNRRNPLPYGGWGSAKPGNLRKLSREHKRTAIKSIRGVQGIIWKWMQDYGLSWHRGFTFMDQNSYVKEMLETYNSQPFNEAIADYGLGAPGFILCSGTHYDDLFAILDGNQESYFFKKMKATYFADDPAAPEKLRKIGEKLRKELTTILKKKGWRIAERTPSMLSITRNKGKYPHEDYYVFPVVPKGSTNSQRFGSLIPYYR